MSLVNSEQNSENRRDAGETSPDSGQACHPESLAQAGWKQQFSTSGQRLAEALETYRSLGLEVKTIPLEELDCDGCRICFENESEVTMMIFTRARAE